MTQTPSRLFASLLVSTFLCFCASQGVAAAPVPQPFVQIALAELEAEVGGPVEATVSPATGLVTFLTFASDRRLQLDLSAATPAVERALGFLDDYGVAFGIFDRQQAVPTRLDGPDEVGMEHVRFRQTHRGVPVTGGELIVHLRDRTVVAVTAKTLGDLAQLETAPTASPAVALEAVRTLLAQRLGVTDAELSEPRLELLNRGLLESRGGWTRLTWFVEASAIDLREFVWVDASSGSPLLHFSQLTDARDREIYDADDPGDGVFDELPGDLVRSEGEGATGDADADDAYDFSGDTYDYFFDEHGRDSYDGAGSTLVSTVHFCPSPGDCPFFNAFWNGVQMVYGEGFPAADDVDAHELTHAVTEHTANLFYYMQSGALNESYSDIFGETVDLTNGSGTDTPGVRWLMGEDIPGIGAIRDMSDPTAFGDPGKMTDGQFVCDDPGGDNGGVHSNSGVPNHAYALMVDGGSYNGHTVTGIDLTKAGKVEYRALAHYLVSASDFLDNYNALRQSCRDLSGTAGITEADCTQVDEALDAVEMGQTWPCSPTQGTAPAICPAGQAPDVLHFLDLETITFTDCPTSTLPTAWCLNGPTSLLGAYATSGVKSLWGYNRPTTGSMSVAVNPLLTLPSGAHLQFNHSHGFENDGATFYDGGVVEYSTNGGASWVDGGPLISAGQTYGGTISACCGNPLAGLSAFAGDSWGYTATQLDLSTLGGQSFRYRFRIGTDNIIDDFGWWVDDVRIYTCAACQVDRVLDAAHSGTAALYQAQNSITAGSGFKIGLSEDVAFEVGNLIALQEGFIVDGGDFTATLTPGVCP